MNCYNHPDVAAIGICKHCNKGLCTDCASDLGHGLACRNKHEKEVEGIEVIMNHAFHLKATQGKYLSFFCVLFGLIFLLYGLYSRTHPSDLLALIGTGFLVYSIVLILNGLKSRQ
ncbi:MAG TPA: hypothetical protein PLA90_06010 [Candidatus Sumerlaeota bacterium]|nr:hypothetical protein [Candidatus Sumerlaeota bacterium]